MGLKVSNKNKKKTKNVVIEQPIEVVQKTIEPFEPNEPVTEYPPAVNEKTPMDSWWWVTNNKYFYVIAFVVFGLVVLLG